MKNVIANVTKKTMAIAIVLSGLSLGAVQVARAADVDCQGAPMVKNLRAYSAPCSAPAAVPQQLTKREVKKLTATAKSAADHLKIAHYYEAEADRLDAQGASYEEAAAAYRHSPNVKNLTSPTTAPRYEYLARGFREEARADHALAALHEQMAKDAGATAELPETSASITQ